MKFIEYAEKLETIKYLAEHKRCGTPLQLSKKFNVSKRTVERMMQQLRDQGFPVTYNRFRATYEVKNCSKKG
jgi:predicted DNA-binding transcriptional regulator YafY